MRRPREKRRHFLRSLPTIPFSDSAHMSSSHSSVPRNMNSLFNPASIAVIGASTNPNSLGNAVCQQLHGSFTGKVFFVNPKGGELLGRPIYKSILDIPEDVEFCVIVVAARFVLGVVNELVKKGVKACHIPSGGFAEFNKEGKALQDEILSVARKGGLRILGPNCIGAYVPEQGMDTFFVPSHLLTRGDVGSQGTISLFSQSGGFAVGWYSEFLKRTQSANHFRSVISYGHGADISETDLLSHGVNDEKTKQIWMYLEGVKEGPAFLKLLRRATPKIPAIIMTGGTTEEGAHAALSHSSSLAPDNKVFKSMLRWAGAVVADGWTDVVNCGHAFMNCPIPKGNRVAVVSNCGGMSVVLTDNLHGLKLAKFDEALMAKARKFFKPPAVVGNPVDMTGSGTMEDFVNMLKLLDESDSVDMIMWNLATFVPLLGGYENIAKRLLEEFGLDAEGKRKVSTPMIGWLYGSTTNHVEDQCNANGLCVMRDEAEAAKVAKVLYDRHLFLEKDKVLNTLQEDLSGDNPVVLQNKLRSNTDLLKIFEIARDEERSALLEHEALTLFKAAGIPIPRFALCTSAEEAARKYASEFDSGTKVVMKVVSPKILHKSDVGGVMLNLASADQVKEAAVTMFDKFSGAKYEFSMKGVLICEMVASGFEMIVGSVSDKNFGPVVMCGIGGILCEIIDDVVFAPCPIQAPDAVKLIDSLENRKLLDTGIRGSGAASPTAIQKIMSRLSILASAFSSQIESIDANPVISTLKHTHAVDARIILKETVRKRKKDAVTAKLRDAAVPVMAMASPTGSPATSPEAKKLKMECRILPMVLDGSK